MLAYVFWHSPEAAVDGERYEALLVAFHRELADEAAAGFIRSEAFRLPDGVPWLDGRPAYEDRYLLDGSAALDPLNDAAVNARMRASHDAVAGLAAAGTAGLYRLIADGDVPDASVAVWLRKPEGVRYADFTAGLRERSRDCALWMRQMVLGPTPEFCVVGAAGDLDADRFPAAWTPRSVRRQRIVRPPEHATAASRSPSSG